MAEHNNSMASTTTTGGSNTRQFEYNQAEAVSFLLDDTLPIYAATVENDEEKAALADRWSASLAFSNDTRTELRRHLWESLSSTTTTTIASIDPDAALMTTTTTDNGSSSVDAQAYLEANLQTREARELFGLEPLPLNRSTTPAMDQTDIIPLSPVPTLVDGGDNDDADADADSTCLEQQQQLRRQFDKEERVFTELRNRLLQTPPRHPKVQQFRQDLQQQGRLLAKLQSDLVMEDVDYTVHADQEEQGPSGDDQQQQQQVQLDKDSLGMSHQTQTVTTTSPSTLPNSPLFSSSSFSSSSEEYYKAMGKNKRVLLTMSLGLGFHGSDYRTAPYQNKKRKTSHDGAPSVPPPTHTMLLTEAQRRCQHYYPSTSQGNSQDVDLASLRHKSTDDLAAWLEDHPIQDNEGRYFEREVQTYLQSLPVREVDFAKNPTVLSRMIWNKDYSGAHQRLLEHPDEASVWVVSYNKSRKRSLRQLPIHTACGHLALEHQDALQHLLRRLAYEHPTSCGMPDHEGKLPLHEAILHGASRDTIVVFLLQYPRALLEPDKYGRTPMDLVRLRGDGTEQEEDVNEIKSLLHKGVAFWERAQEREQNQQAPLLEGPTGDSAMTMTPLSSTTTTAVATDTAMSTTRRTTAAAAAVDTDVNTTSSSTTLHSLVKKDAAQSEKEETVETLRSRCTDLEEQLVHLYEKKSESDEVKEKLMARVTALDTLNHQDSTDQDRELSAPARSTAELEEENERLQARIAELTSPTTSRPDTTTADADLVSDLTAQSTVLQDRIGSLTENLVQSKERIGQLEMQVDLLKKRPGDDSGLLEAIVSKSSRATERYLANVVLSLRQELSDAVQRANAKTTTAQDEMARLRRDNHLLKRELDKHTDPTIHASTHDKTAEANAAINNLAGPNDDELQDWLAEAAAMYGTSKRQTIAAASAEMAAPVPENREFFVPPLDAALATASQRYSQVPKDNNNNNSTNGTTSTNKKQQQQQRLFRWKR